MMALGISPARLSSALLRDREKPNPKAQLFYVAPVLTEQIAMDVNAMCHHMFLMAGDD